MNVRQATAVSFGLFVVFLTGCAASFDPSPIAQPGQTSSFTINGNAHGGRQPISGAHVYLYQAGTTGNAGRLNDDTTSNASTSLLEAYNTGAFPTQQDGSGNYYVTTDANGNFSITGEYNACATGGQVYLYANGGNTGAGATNSYAGLMATLGTCGSFGSGTTVDMNEVSTVATAFALAGFASDATHISSSGSALAQVGLANAFANANQLYDISSNPYNNPPGARSTTPGSGTNGGTGTLDSALVNTIADVLAACINTNGSFSTGTPCNKLINTARSAGSVGNQPHDTASAAIFIAQFPTSDVTTLYGVIGPNPPFTPWYSSAAPANFAVTLTFAGGGYAATSRQPRSLAIDGAGNVWVAPKNNASGGVGTTLAEFSPLGVPASSTGYTDSDLLSPVALAVAPDSNSIWVTTASSFAVVFPSSGSPSVDDYVCGSPTDITFDGNGHLVIACSAAVTVRATDNTSLATLFGNGMGNPTTAVAQPGASGEYIAYSTDGYFSIFNSDYSANQYADVGIVTNQFVAENNGYIVAPTTNASEILEYRPASDSESFYSIGAGTGVLAALATDGDWQYWVASTDASSGSAADDAILVLDRYNGTFLGSAGLPIPQPAPPANAIRPDAIAVDGSGDLWYTTTGDNNLREIIGIAIPVVTPLSYGEANSLLNTRP